MYYAEKGAIIYPKEGKETAVMAYQKSVYFIPVWFDQYQSFVKKLAADSSWEKIPGEALTPRYLLNYAVRIARNDTLFQSFRRKKDACPEVYLFEKELPLQTVPKINEIRFSCFSTGVGFLEFWVEYEGLTIEQIVNFAFHFKKAAGRKDRCLPQGKVWLYDAAAALLPEGCDARLFFTVTDPLKYECLCYHFVQLPEAPAEEAADQRICLLKRSYHTGFTISSGSDYDMIYKPYANDHWGGCPEGLANISYDEKQDPQDGYLRRWKQSHLEVDYYFLYLLLLNQRFSAIQYITQIAEVSDSGRREIEAINRRIVKLKTAFAFNVISDDQIFQNVYAKMYQVLDIPHLLEDIRDNENQMEMLQSASSARADKMSSKFLAGISALSLFSAMVDAASYFDRVSWLSSIATGLGLICTGLVVLLCILWILKTRNDR